jgi:hypothetical protein
MIGHTEALAQQDDNAMDIDEEIISVEILESLGVNTGDGTLLHFFFLFFFFFFSRRQIEFSLKLTLLLSSLSSSLLSFPKSKNYVTPVSTACSSFDRLHPRSSCPSKDSVMLK